MATSTSTAHACYRDGLHAEPIAALPEVDVVAHAEIQKPQPGLAIPFRDGALNLYLGYKGAKSISVDGTHYNLAGGDFFLTPPGIRHSTPSLPMTRCAHYWLRLRLDLPRPFLGDPGLDGLRGDLRRLGVVHGRYAPGDLLALRTIHGLCAGAASPQRDLRVRLHLGLLLLQIVGHAADAPPTGSQPALERVTDHLRRHVGEDLGVAEMADIAGLSVSGLQNLFRARLGMPPAEWFTRLKLDEARRLLRETELPVREIAQRLGYASDRYFSAAFRRYFLQPPGRFRAAQR